MDSALNNLSLAASYLTGVPCGALRPQNVCPEELDAESQGFSAGLFRKIADGMRESGKTSAAAPRSMASRGMPNTTHVASF